MSDNAYQLGIALVKNSVLDFDVLEQALNIKNNDENRGRRNLAQILVNDFDIDHNAVYKQVAKMYGFPEISYSDALLTDERIAFIQKTVESVSEEIQQLMRDEKVIVLQKDPHVSNKLLLVAADPTPA